MPTNGWLTIGDVYKPPTPKEALENRLLELSIGDEARKHQQTEEYQRYIMEVLGAQGGGNAMAPAGASPPQQRPTPEIPTNALASPGPLQAPQGAPPMIAGPTTFPGAANEQNQFVMPPKGAPEDPRAGYGPGVQDLVQRQPAGGPRQPRTYAEYTAQQGLIKQQREEAMVIFKPMLEGAIAAGDQPTVDSLLRAAKRSPVLAPIVSWIGDPDGDEPQRLKVTGKGKTETESEVTTPMLAGLVAQAATPVMAEIIKTSPPGRYNIQTQAGKIVHFKQLEAKTHGALDQAAMAKYNKKYAELTAEQREGIDALVYGKGTGAVADAVKQVTSGKKQYYAQLDPKERKAVDELVQKQAFNVQIGGEAGRIAAQSGGTNAFDKWTTAEKEQSFENFIVNNQRPVFGFRDLANRQAWEREYNQYLIRKGQSAEGVGEQRFYRGAQKKALEQNEGYRAAAERFVSVIDKNAELVRTMRKKYGTNYGRLVNSAVNYTKQGITGSGDLAALQQVLISLSNEVAKVESGSMGIAEVSVEQAKQWKKIHDYNLNAEDLDTVLNTSRQLGQIRRDSLKDVTQTLRKGLGEKETPPGAGPPPASKFTIIEVKPAR